MRLVIENGLEFVADCVENEKGKIFFCHPFTGSLTSKLNFRSHFKDYSFYGINFPGHGNSVINSQKELDFSHWLELASNFFNKHNLTDVILLGHSIGGGLVVALTNKLSCKQVRAVVLEAPLNPAISHTPIEIIKGLIPQPEDDFTKIQKALIYGIEQKLGENFQLFCEREKQKIMARYLPLNIMLNPKHTEKSLALIHTAFKKLNKPLLWIHGKQDGIINFTASQNYIKSLNSPFIQLVEFENTAHAPAFEQPQQFLKTVSEFFKTI